MKMAEYLGNPASCMLSAEPFKYWPVERSVDDDSDPPDVAYVFVGCGLELNCDRDDERVRSIFLDAEMHAGTVLSEVPFHLTRGQVIGRLGPPTKSGKGVSHPVLGELGAWDRFQDSEYTMHVQYKVAEDSIEKITLMRNDVVP